MTAPHPTSSGLAPKSADPTPAETYIDWGPELPGRFSSGRARLMVVNPTTLHLSWETAADSSLAKASAWIAEVRCEGASLLGTCRVDGLPETYAYNCWLTVSPATSGTVRLIAVEANGHTRRICDLAFKTPADAPADDFDEHWGHLDALGEVVSGVEAVSGRRVDIETSTPAGSATARPPRPAKGASS